MLRYRTHRRRYPELSTRYTRNRLGGPGQYAGSQTLAVHCSWRNCQRRTYLLSIGLALRARLHNPARDGTSSRVTSWCHPWLRVFPMPDPDFEVATHFQKIQRCMVRLQPSAVIEYQRKKHLTEPEAAIPVGYQG